MWDNFKAWAAKPFSADMDAMHWFYFIGFLIVLMVAWRLILATITEEL